MTQGLDASRADVDPIDMKELHFRDGTAVDPVEDLVGVRTLDLEAVMRAINRLAVGAGIGPRIVCQANLVVVDRLLELDPVGRRRTANQHEFILALAENDHVADDMAGRCHRHEMLGAVQIEVGKTVDADVLEKSSRIRTFDDELVHVMGLVEQHGGFPPGHLLVSPVRELGRHDRVHVHTDLRVAQQVYSTAMRLDQGAQIVFRHCSSRDTKTAGRDFKSAVNDLTFAASGCISEARHCVALMLPGKRSTVT